MCFYVQSLLTHQIDPTASHPHRNQSSLKPPCRPSSRIHTLRPTRQSAIIRTRLPILITLVRINAQLPPLPAHKQAPVLVVVPAHVAALGGPLAAGAAHGAVAVAPGARALRDTADAEAVEDVGAGVGGVEVAADAGALDEPGGGVWAKEGVAGLAGRRERAGGIHVVAGRGMGCDATRLDGDGADWARGGIDSEGKGMMGKLTVIGLHVAERLPCMHTIWETVSHHGIARCRGHVRQRRRGAPLAGVKAVVVGVAVRVA